MILLILLCFIIYGTFKIPMNKKWSIYVYDILICFISLFYALISADQEHGRAGTLIAYIYITMLLPIMIITKFIINMVKLRLWFSYRFYVYITDILSLSIST